MDIKEQILILDEAESTNSILMDFAKSNPDLPQLYSVIARNQTAGRGQRGNSWFVTPNKNLTYSFFLRLGDIKANEQYAISEYVVCSVLRALSSYLSPEQSNQLCVKWPNDIYYGDRKLGGILIEHSLSGMFVDYSIVGIGLNINEECFSEDLPNPISLRQITGQEYSIDEIHGRLMLTAEQMLESLLLADYREMHEQYMDRLYRREGLHNYHDAEGTFRAEICDVQPSGHLVLRDEQGEERIYAFKEVVFDAD